MWRGCHPCPLAVVSHCTPPALPCAATLQLCLLLPPLYPLQDNLNQTPTEALPVEVPPYLQVCGGGGGGVMV